MISWAVVAVAALSTRQIFNEGFARMQSYPVPAYAVWTATWHIDSRPMGYYTGTSSSVEVSRYAVRLSDGMENVSAPIPSGKLPPAIVEPQFLGPFAWTMRSSVHPPAAAGSSVMMQPDVSGLKTIAEVVAVAKPAYAFAGDTSATPPAEEVDGRRAYHIQLRPLGDPRKHNLRDLWIDVETYDLVKAHFVGTYAPFPKAPIGPTEVTVHFRNVLGCWVVSRAQWSYDDAPMRFEFDVQNDEIAMMQSLPDWLFDADAYRRHEQAGEPDYLGLLLERLRKSG